MCGACPQSALPAASAPAPTPGQVEITPIDANHCPGAVMLLFKIPSPNCAPGAQPPAAAGAAGAAAAGAAAPGAAPAFTTVLHTGDFRWHAGMAAHPALAGLRIDCLMLDTTYCQPKWRFPPQAQAVASIVAEMRREAAADPGELSRCTHMRQPRCWRWPVS